MRDEETPDAGSPLLPAGARQAVPPGGVLATMVALYVVVLGQLTWRQQSNFGTFGFDMGIYDQAIWLLSRFREPFSTIRGLHYFGFHVNVVAFLLVPVYWLGGGPHALYLIETAAMASGAVPLWLLARDRLASPWLALAPSAAYLLSPSLEWINWWHFHPETLAIAPLLFAWWLASRRRWGWFAFAIGLALICKEDVALAVAAMGFATALKFGRTAGGITTVVGLAWFVICTRVVIPHFDGGQAAFYTSFFPALGTSLPQVAKTAVVHPSRWYRPMLAHDRHTYYLQLLAPVAFICLLGGWSALLVGVPQLVVNTAGTIGYAHDIKYHYTSLVLVAVWLGTVEAIGARARRTWTRTAFAAVLVAAALASNVAWSDSPLSVHYHDGEWAHASATSRAEAAAVRQVPPGAGVTASYSMDTHLTHRVHIFEWPNPFVSANWGIDDGSPLPRSDVTYLVLDTTLNPDTRPLLDALLAPGGPFKVVWERRTIIVARRVTP